MIENKYTWPKIWKVVNDIQLISDAVGKVVTPKVGDYVYSDLTVGEEIKEDIIGIVAIPKYMTPDNKERIIPIKQASVIGPWRHSITDTSNLTYLASDSSDFSIWVDTGITSEYINSDINPKLYINRFSEPISNEPYLEDGSKNPLFKLDFWNARNTDILQEDSSSIFAAAYNFTTDGTKIGDWHVPTISEIVVISANKDLLENKIGLVNPQLSDSYFYGNYWVSERHYIPSDRPDYLLCWYWDSSGILASELSDRGYKLLPVMSISLPPVVSLNTPFNSLSSDFQILAQLVVQQQSEIEGLKTLLKNNLGDITAKSISLEKLPIINTEALELFGTGAPTKDPKFLGQRYYDTTNKKEYIATSLTIGGTNYGWTQL